MHPPTVHWHLFCSFACRQTDRVMGDGRTHCVVETKVLLHKLAV